jgi:hypothetical protein
MFEVRDYLTAQGDDPYAQWVISLADIEKTHQYWMDWQHMRKLK